MVNQLTWVITHLCNYRCSYCHVLDAGAPRRNRRYNELIQREHHVLKEVPEKLELARKIRAFLDETGEVWNVTLTGGEPTILPELIQVAEHLACTQQVAIDTNGSRPDRIDELCARLPPSRLTYFMVSLHLQEMEQRGHSVGELLDTLLKLKDRGYRAVLCYVAHPATAAQLAELTAPFRAAGVEVLPRPFKGSYEDRIYPDPGSHSREERIAMARINPRAAAKMPFDLRDLPCDAGRRYMYVEADGTAYRCCQYAYAPQTGPGSGVLGSFATTGVRLAASAERCGATRCYYTGLGLVHASPSHQRFIEAMKAYYAGNEDVAIDLFAKAAEADPSYANPCLNLAALYRNQGSLELARQWIGRARHLAPDSPEVARCHEWVHGADPSAGSREYGRMTTRVAPLS